MKLTKKQTAALDALEDDETNELVFGGGAGGAKSVLGCYWGTKMCMKYPGCRGVIGRGVLKTLKETTLNTLWWVFKQQGLVQNVHYKYNEQMGKITFTNTSEILLKDLKQYPKDIDFDELGSLEITWAFVDECNQLVKKAWDVLKSRLRFRLNDYCNRCGSQHVVETLEVDENGLKKVWVCDKGHKTSGLIPKILGTCNPAKNWVYSYFYGPNKTGDLPGNRKFIQSLLGDNRYISRHYKENLLSLDENGKQRLLYGNWEYDDDPAALCSYDAICDLFHNDHIQADGNSYISADLAMQGRDRFVGGLWDGLICDIRIDKKKATGKEIEEDLRKLINFGNVPRSHVVVDSDGLGNYLESYLTGVKEFHANATANNSIEYASIKSECGFKLAELINKRLIKIICTDEQREKIIEDVGVLKRAFVDGDNKRKSIINKDLMKETLARSPDYLDMLIMRMMFEVTVEVYGYAV